MNIMYICRNLKVRDQWYYLVIQKLFAFTFVILRVVSTTLYYIYLGFVVFKNEIKLEKTWLIFYGSFYFLNLYWGFIVIKMTARKLGCIKRERKSNSKLTKLSSLDKTGNIKNE